ncbi:MAG: DeoR/GlpR family DNA-binding transcription regulator [Clostridia bacterium]|nr:DeoR/GlpR family DNA-binding transcription regulator [Clostridia bacterium]
MLAIERKNIILSRLSAQGKIIVSDLSKEFGVSEETIRRDIEKLAREGLATKTYGGAVSNVSPSTDLPYNIRKKTNVEQKEFIAECVAEMIHDGDRIMLDASSTAIYVTRKIKDKRNITVITNSVEILLELADKTGWTILSTGGTLKEGGLSMVGASAEKMIRDHHVDFAICSAKGIDFGMGITDSNEKDAEMKQAIFAAADKRVLAIDNSKFDKISFIKVCDIGDVDIVVTNKMPDEVWQNKLADKGVTLVCDKTNELHLF